MAVPLEIACDESGSEGEKVVGGTTRMFAHASVDIDAALAADCIVELRGRTRSPAEEYKASVVLRTQNRSALVWLLGDGGPLAGRAHVHLVEKQAYAVRELVALVGGPAPLADALHREAAEEVGEAAWTGLLSAFNDLMRARGRVDVELTGAAFLRRVDALPGDGAVGALAGPGARRRPGGAAGAADRHRPDDAAAAAPRAGPGRRGPALGQRVADRSCSCTTSSRRSPRAGSPTCASCWWSRGTAPGRWSTYGWWTRAPTPGCRWRTCWPARPGGSRRTGSTGTATTPCASSSRRTRDG